MEDPRDALRGRYKLIDMIVIAIGAYGLLALQAFEACFRAWVEAIRAAIPGEVIALGGKTPRYSDDRAARGRWGIESALHRSFDVAIREDDSRGRARTWRCCATARSHN